MKRRNAPKLDYLMKGRNTPNSDRLMNRLMKRNASIMDRLMMKRNAQYTLNWIQLHHEVLKLRGYVEWWGAAVKWGTERVPDHVTRHHLIFICIERLDFLHMRRLDSDQSLWDRFVSSICWSRNKAVLQLSDELIFWFYGDNRGIKHPRHDRAEDDRARRALNEAVKISRNGDLGPQMNLDRWAHRWDHRWPRRGNFRGGNFLYNEVDFPSRFSRQRYIAIHSFRQSIRFDMLARQYISLNEIASPTRNIIQTLTSRYKLSDSKVIEQLHEQYQALNNPPVKAKIEQWISDWEN